MYYVELFSGCAKFTKQNRNLQNIPIALNTIPKISKSFHSCILSFHQVKASQIPQKQQRDISCTIWGGEKVSDMKQQIVQKLQKNTRKKKIYKYFSLERGLKTSLCLKAHKLWPLLFQHPHPAKNSGTCSPAEAHQGTYPHASQSKTRALILQSSVLKGARSQMFGKLTQVCRRHLLICPWTWSAAQ